MAKNVDVFGFDELEKAFNRMEKKYPDKADAMLMAIGQAANKKTKENTPVYRGTPPPNSKIKPGQLKRSWRLKKVKLYKGGTVRVVHIQSSAPHAHLVEQGHDIYRGGKVYVSGKTGDSTGRKGGYKRKLNAVQRNVREITSHGRTRAFHMLEYAMVESRNRFNHDAEKLLDAICEEVEV